MGARLSYIPFTVCIPTYLGGASLVRAVESIRASEGVRSFRIIVAVDGQPLSDSVARQLRAFDVDIVCSKQRGGQVARIKQMVAMVDTELTVLTQDDIRFHKLALAHLVRAFADDQHLTMVGANVLPEPAKTLFERVVEVGVAIGHHAGKQWRGADNYLLASGRCLVLRTGALQKFVLPEEIINSDAYLYFENKRRGGTFRYHDQAIVYNKSPLRVSEHIKQAKKFDYSKAELARYFGEGIGADYVVPRRLLMSALWFEFRRRPLHTLLYGGLQLYTRLQPNQFIGAKRFWDTDTSTKRI